MKTKFEMNLPKISKINRLVGIIESSECADPKSLKEETREIIINQGQDFKKAILKAWYLSFITKREGAVGVNELDQFGAIATISYEYLSLNDFLILPEDGVKVNSITYGSTSKRFAFGYDAALNRENIIRLYLNNEENRLANIEGFAKGLGLKTTIRGKPRIYTNKVKNIMMPIYDFFNHDTVIDATSNSERYPDEFSSLKNMKDVVKNFDNDHNHYKTFFDLELTVGLHALYKIPLSKGSIKQVTILLQHDFPQEYFK